MSNKLVIIPTYNEKENIEAIIKAVLTVDGAFDILIVDDSSPDGTGDIIKGLIPQSNGRLHLEVRTIKISNAPSTVKTAFIMASIFSFSL